MRWLRSDDGAASSSVATVAGPREGMPLPFSLPRVSTARAASPCRLVFQLLKHPMHVQAIRNVAAGQTHRTVPLVPRLCSSTDASLSLSLSFFLFLSRSPRSKAEEPASNHDPIPRETLPFIVSSSPSYRLYSDTRVQLFTRDNLGGGRAGSAFRVALTVTRYAGTIEVREPRPSLSLLDLRIV